MGVARNRTRVRAAERKLLVGLLASRADLGVGKGGPGPPWQKTFYNYSNLKNYYYYAQKTARVVRTVLLLQLRDVKTAYFI